MKTSTLLAAILLEAGALLVPAGGCNPTPPPSSQLSPTAGTTASGELVVDYPAKLVNDICETDIRGCVTVLLRWSKTPIRVATRWPSTDEPPNDQRDLVVRAVDDAVTELKNAGVNIEVASSPPVEGETEITVTWCIAPSDGCELLSSLASSGSPPLAVADFPHENQPLELRLDAVTIHEQLQQIPVGAPQKNFMFRVVLHELCHTIGLQHSKSDASVMRPTVDTRLLGEQVALSAEDKKQIEARYGPSPAHPAAPLEFSGERGLPVEGEIDSDRDGLPDVFEQLATRTLWSGEDRDGDGRPDGWDTDGDGLSDGAEYANQLDPLRRDTDGDTIDDAVEIQQGTDPWSPTQVLGNGRVRVPAQVVACTIGSSGAGREVALTQRDLDHGGFSDGDCVTVHVDTGSGPTVPNVAIRKLDVEGPFKCVVGLSPNLRQELGIGAERTLVAVVIERSSPDALVLGPHAAIEIVVPHNEDSVNNKTAVEAHVMDVAGPHLIAQGWVRTAENLWPQPAGALTSVSCDASTITFLVHYFGSGGEDQSGLPFRLYVTLSPVAQPVNPPLTEFPSHILLKSPPIDVVLGAADSDCDCIPDSDDPNSDSAERTITDFASDAGIVRVASEGVSGFLFPVETPSSLRVQWTIIGPPTYCSVGLVPTIPVHPCQKVRVDIEALTEQAIRIELKTGDHSHPEDFVRREVHRFLARQRRTVELEVSRTFELNDVTFAMEDKQQENGVRSGTFIVHRITLCGAP